MPIFRVYQIIPSVSLNLFHKIFIFFFLLVVGFLVHIIVTIAVGIVVIGEKSYSVLIRWRSQDRLSSQVEAHGFERISFHEYNSIRPNTLLAIITFT